MFLIVCVKKTMINRSCEKSLFIEKKNYIDFDYTFSFVLRHPSFVPASQIMGKIIIMIIPISYFNKDGGLECIQHSWPCVKSIEYSFVRTRNPNLYLKGLLYVFFLCVYVNKPFTCTPTHKTQTST